MQTNVTLHVAILDYYMLVDDKLVCDNSIDKLVAYKDYNIAFSCKDNNNQDVFF